MTYTEKLTLLAGQNGNTLRKIENDHGDIYYRITLQGNDNGKIAYAGTIEFSSEKLARDYFAKNVVKNLKVKAN